MPSGQISKIGFWEDLSLSPKKLLWNFQLPRISRSKTYALHAKDLSRPTPLTPQSLSQRWSRWYGTGRASRSCNWRSVDWLWWQWLMCPHIAISGTRHSRLSRWSHKPSISTVGFLSLHCVSFVAFNIVEHETGCTRVRCLHCHCFTFIRDTVCTCNMSLKSLCSRTVLAPRLWNWRGGRSSSKLFVEMAKWTWRCWWPQQEDSDLKNEVLPTGPNW